MEGVLVSAKKTGSNITVTVVSDKEGRYSFPATRLEPGDTRSAFARSDTRSPASRRRSRSPTRRRTSI